jgi:hypothetical protein
MLRLVSLATMLFSLSAPAHAQEPENAIIVIIDGLRHDDGWALESQYLPRIWNDLRPLGTYHADFWDRGWTATTGGHTTILSGVRQILRNNGGNDQDVRSFDPLAFEYYRWHFGTPESSCGVVVGKWGNVGAIADFALEPAYGEPFQGFQLGVNDVSHSDTAATRVLIRAMDSLHARLMLVNLPDVDGTGHAGDYVAHLNAIRVADSCIFEIWNRIQAVPPYTDTFYRNRTVLIVTSDHGRNDDAHGGFTGHGEWDHGSRQLGLLAVGPGIAPASTVTGVSRDQIDILPTIAAMLSFPTPFAEGNVMTELFAPDYAPKPAQVPSSPLNDAVNLSNTSGFSRDPDVCRDRNGNLCLVWSDKSTDDWGVRFRKSTDDGASWSGTQSLFDFPSAESVMWYARVAADDSLAVSAIGIGRHLSPVDPLDPLAMDTTFLWYPWLATSTDAGGTWSYSSLLDSSMGSYYAPVALRNGRVSVAWWAVGQFTWQTPRNGVFFNSRTAGGSWLPLPVKTGSQQGIHIALADDGAACHIAASLWDGQDYDIAYRRSTDAGVTWVDARACEDPDGTPQYDYDPELVVDSSAVVHVFWARRENVGGAWAVMHAWRDPLTGVFDTARLFAPAAGAWQPHAALRGDTIMLVWTDYRDGNPEIYSSFSWNEGADWTQAERVSYSSAISHHPRVTVTGTGFYCVWQDLASGNWDIYGRPLGTFMSRDAGVVRIDAPTGSRDTLAGIFPQATITNLGPVPASLRLHFILATAGGTEVYRESLDMVDVEPGAQTGVEFPAWTQPHPSGAYTARCSLAYLGDQNALNDQASGIFAITPPAPGWREMQSLPASQSGRAAKDGAWLAHDHSSGRIYAARGYKTADFHCYDAARDSWCVLDTFPAGPDGRLPYKGAAGASDGDGTIYATKGNNTLEFYSYSAAANDWTPMPPVPEGIYRKKVKGGTDMAYAVINDTGYVYLLKGYKNEFYRYNTLKDSWQDLAAAPVGVNLKWDKGSWLAFDGASTILAHKAKYHEFYAYDILGATWCDTLVGMPLRTSRGSDRKARDGSCGEWLDGSVYALKGTNTQDFWRYDPPGDSWHMLDTIPAYGSAGVRKRPKSGASLTAVEPALLYALKGNKCNEFWRYFVAELPGRHGAQASVARPPQPGVLRVVPNPLSTDMARVCWSMVGQSSEPGHLSISFYDICGRRHVRVPVSPSAEGTADVKLDRLPDGVYLVRLEAGAGALTERLVLTR